MEKEAVPYLKMAQVTEYFDGRVFGDMVEHGKPDPKLSKQLTAVCDSLLDVPYLLEK